MAARTDVVVVGGGVMGTSIAFHLAARSRRVVLLERSSLCSGPTRHSTAIIRLHYTQPLLVQMAAHGLRTYREFETVVGSPAGFVRTGMLFCVEPRERELLASNVAVGRAEGAETHLLEADELARIDPRIVAEELAFCFEPEAGYCDPYPVTLGFAQAAARAGAELRELVSVTEITPRGVETSAGAIDAETVVIAAGPWTPPLLAPLGYDLLITAAPAEVGRFLPRDRLEPPPPALADFSSAQIYFRPAPGGVLEVGSIAPEHAETPVDPDAPTEGARAETLRAYEQALARRLRGCEGGHWRGAWTGIYDVTPDWEPVIGRVPGADNVVVAAGFSGHGFKLAPAVGLAVSELVVDGSASTFDLELLAPDRFARGALVGARYGYSVLG